MSRSPDVAEFVDVTFSPRHSFQNITSVIDQLHSLLLEELTHLVPERFRELLVTDVGVRAIPEADMLVTPVVVVDFDGLLAFQSLDDGSLFGRR